MIEDLEPNNKAFSYFLQKKPCDAKKAVIFENLEIFIGKFVSYGIFCKHNTKIP